MHGIRHANDEKENEHDDEPYERVGIHQPGQTSLANLLTLHGTSHFLLLPTRFRMS